MANLYRGFSTYNRSKKYRVVDFSLVKQDLINHFNVRKGEKLMQPSFGTIIWSMLFEPMTDALRQAVIEDVTAVVNYDPRVQVINVNLTEKQYGLQIEIDLKYAPTDESDTLIMNFDRNAQTLTTNS